MKHQIMTKEGQDESVVILPTGKGEPFTAGSEHPNFKRIVETIRSVPAGQQFTDAGEAALLDLFDVSIGVGQKWATLSERVSASRGRLYFDGDPVDDTLSEMILKFYRAGLDDSWKPLVKFMEKVITNPEPHSRDNLFRWMNKHEFAIDGDGDLIAYKGVGRDFLSSHSGEAFVNGVLIKGRIPCQPNTVVEMPRSAVTHDPSNPCSYGLHAASWSYAHSFMSSGGKTVAMKINPRDVVSVPTDANDEKMRVCRYHCMGEVTQPIADLLFVTNAAIAKRLEAYDAALCEDEPEHKPKRERKATSKPRKIKFPQFYHDFSREHFAACEYNELRWVCKEWGVSAQGTRPELVTRLVHRRPWAKRNNR